MIWFRDIFDARFSAPPARRPEADVLAERDSAENERHLWNRCLKNSPLAFQTDAIFNLNRDIQAQKAEPQNSTHTHVGTLTRARASVSFPVVASTPKTTTSLAS